MDFLACDIFVELVRHIDCIGCCHDDSCTLVHSSIEVYPWFAVVVLASYIDFWNYLLLNVASTSTAIFKASLVSSAAVDNTLSQMARHAKSNPFFAVVDTSFGLGSEYIHVQIVASASNFATCPY